MKSILFFGWFFYPKTGGAETILLNQARTLVQRGYKVSVLTSVLGDGLETDSEVFGITVYRRRYVDPLKSYDRNEIEESVTTILEQAQPDIAHFHNGSYPSGGLFKGIGAETIKILFETIHATGVHMIEHAHNAQLKGTEETKVLRDLPWDRVLCVSQFVKDEWLKLGTAAKDLTVVYNGIDLQRFENIAPAAPMVAARGDNRVVLFCPARMVSLTSGTLNKQKNIALILDALVLLKQKGITNFVLVAIANEALDTGTNAAITLLAPAINERGLEDHVVLLPIIDPDLMPAYYAGSDILSVPAVNETFGLMYLEAMASKKVAIASNTGGPREYIHNGENGYFVDTEHPQELATVLENLISNPSLREQIGEAGYQSAQEFTIEKMVDGIEQVYANLE